MKRIFAIPFLLVGMLLLTVSCNEELQIATYDQEAPSIASFTPTTGPVGTLVTVRGAGLHRIEKAYINDAEVEIRYAISGNEIVLRTTTAGSTGPSRSRAPTARSGAPKSSPIPIRRPRSRPIPNRSPWVTRSSSSVRASTGF